MLSGAARGCRRPAHRPRRRSRLALGHMRMPRLCPPRGGTARPPRLIRSLNATGTASVPESRPPSTENPSGAADPVPGRGTGGSCAGPGPASMPCRARHARKASMSWQRIMQSMARAFASLVPQAQPGGTGRSVQTPPAWEPRRQLRGRKAAQPPQRAWSGPFPAQASRVRLKNFIRQLKPDKR